MTAYINIHLDPATAPAVECADLPKSPTRVLRMKCGAQAIVFFGTPEQIAALQDAVHEAEVEGETDIHGEG